MHYIVEVIEQLSYLGDPSDACFINIITEHDSQHPLLSSPCLIYVRPFRDNKGYIVVVDHPEGLSIPLPLVKEALSKYKQLYCLNSKYHEYLIDLPVRDINYTAVDQQEIPIKNRGDGVLINSYYTKYIETFRNINKIIPISKHYEYWEEIYKQVRKYVPYLENTDWNFYTRYTEAYRKVEKQGLRIDTRCFVEHYTPKYISDFYKDGIIYTNYNLYNTTARPTNAFNGINFLALNKEDTSRKCFIPQNDCFVEFDFDGYHLRLIATLIDYPLPVDISVHTYFGQYYFNKKELSEEEYTLSKQITFQNIYGKVQEQYKDHPFYAKLTEYLEALWEQYIVNKKLQLPTGRIITYEDDARIGKLFNYVIQNLETNTNLSLLEELYELFREKISFINLVVYDSFLVDYSLQDGKDLLVNIATHLKQRGYPVKAKYGENYHDLKKIQVF